MERDNPTTRKRGEREHATEDLRAGRQAIAPAGVLAYFGAHQVEDLVAFLASFPSALLCQRVRTCVRMYVCVCARRRAGGRAGGR